MLTKKKIILTLIALMLVLQFACIQAAFGFQGEPTGWGNNKWGTPIEYINCGLEKLKSIKEINIDIYRPDIKLKTCRTMLIFLGGKLAMITTKTNSLKYAEMFSRLHIHLYGQPTKVWGDYLIWKGQTTDIQLDVVRGISTMGSPAGMASVDRLLTWHQRGNKTGEKGTEGRENI